MSEDLSQFESMRAEPGDVLAKIDQYELICELGGGGFGAVYQARDAVSGVEYAVKGLPAEVKGSREELENIRSNFQLVSRLHHPNIAAALVLHPAREVWYASDEVRRKLRVRPGEPLLVMEYAPGTTLSKWRRQFPAGRVPLEQALEIVRQIANALDYAHGQKVLHRDVKPSNVMIETKMDGRIIARVLDFGLAAEIRSSMGRVSREVRDTSGTRPYMAPEQWLGKPQREATDQYALAVLFYELLAGEVPFASVFETGDPAVMANAVGTRAPEFSPGLPRRVRSALTTALAKRPEARFPDCGAFVASLAGVSAKKRNGWMWKAPALGFAFAFALFGWRVIETDCLNWKVRTDTVTPRTVTNEIVRGVANETDPRPGTAEQEADVRPSRSVCMQTNAVSLPDRTGTGMSAQQEGRGNTGVANSTETSRLRFGILTSLTACDADRETTNTWFAIRQLKTDGYKMKMVRSGRDITDDLDVLVAIHPKNLTLETLSGISGYLAKGGRMLACVDPLSMMEWMEIARSRRSGASEAANCSSTIGSLFHKWGLSCESGEIVADMSCVTRTLNRASGKTDPDPLILSLGPGNRNQRDLATGGDSLIVLPFSGALKREREIPGVSFTPLLFSSAGNSCLVSSEKCLGKWNESAANLAPDGKSHVLAARVRGIFPSGGGPFDLFNREAEVVIVCDSDFLADMFAVREVDTLFGKMQQRINGNIDFFRNAIDSLARSRREQMQQGGARKLFDVLPLGTVTVEPPLLRVGDSFRLLFEFAWPSNATIEVQSLDGFPDGAVSCRENLYPSPDVPLPGMLPFPFPVLRGRSVAPEREIRSVPCVLKRFSLKVRATDPVETNVVLRLRAMQTVRSGNNTVSTSLTGVFPPFRLKIDAKDSDRTSGGGGKIPASSKVVSGKCLYTVKRGDTVPLIALRHGIRTRDLLDANPGLNRLRVGQVLVIPGKSRPSPET